MSDITQIINNGISANRIDIMFVSEGYLPSERSKFLSDAS